MLDLVLRRRRRPDLSSTSCRRDSASRHGASRARRRARRTSSRGPRCRAATRRSRPARTHPHAADDSSPAQSRSDPRLLERRVRSDAPPAVVIPRPVEQGEARRHRRGPGERREGDPDWRVGPLSASAARPRADAALASRVRPSAHARRGSDPAGWRWRRACARIRAGASFSPTPEGSATDDLHLRDGVEWPQVANEVLPHGEC